MLLNFHPFHFNDCHWIAGCFDIEKLVLGEDKCKRQGYGELHILRSTNRRKLFHILYDYCLDPTFHNNHISMANILYSREEEIFDDFQIDGGDVFPRIINLFIGHRVCTCHSRFLGPR